MENAMWAFMLFSVSVICFAVVFNNLSRHRQVKRADSWPIVEATIQSGKLEIVRHQRFNDIQLPVFELAYVVEQKPYIEQFALSMTKEPLDLLLAKMIAEGSPCDTIHRIRGAVLYRAKQSRVAESNRRSVPRFTPIRKTDCFKRNALWKLDVC